MITAFVRTVLLYALLLAGLRLAGKRQIGQLEPIELVLMMLLSDLASVPMQDFGIPLLYGVIPIVTLLALSTLLSYFSLRSVRFRSLLCGEPTIVIRDGRLLQDAMRHNRLTLDELLESLRSQGVCDMTSVKYAVLETNGQLSVLPYAPESPVTPRQLGLSAEDDVSLPIIVINDGRLLRKNLHRAGHNEVWLQKILSEAGVHSTKQVFLLTVDEREKTLLIPREVKP